MFVWNFGYHIIISCAIAQYVYNTKHWLYNCRKEKFFFFRFLFTGWAFSIQHIQTANIWIKYYWNLITACISSVRYFAIGWKTIFKFNHTASILVRRSVIVKIRNGAFASPMLKKLKPKKNQKEWEKFPFEGKNTTIFIL